MTSWSVVSQPWTWHMLEAYVVQAVRYLYTVTESRPVEFRRQRVWYEVTWRFESYRNTSCAFGSSSK